MVSSRDSIFKTLAYADIFDYPLRPDEIWSFLISDRKINRKLFNKALKFFFFKNGFFCFSNRSKIIGQRLEREEKSKHKIVLAQKISSYLSKIPTICLIGISGSLAMKNSDEDDDIDFFIITKKNTLWISRLLCLIVLELFGKRRKRLEKKAKDKACINMIIDETALLLPSDRHDIYTAHEVIQFIPAFQRNDMYHKFIFANRWVKKFFPNVVFKKNKSISCGMKLKNNLVKNNLWLFLEYFAKKIQYWYIKKHLTKERIFNNFLAFHPVDYRDKIISLYEKNLRRYKEI